MASPAREQAAQTLTGYAASFEPVMATALGLVSADTEPDVPVGAVVLAGDGTVIGQGRNRCLADSDPTAHAEIVAIRQAAVTAGCWRLDGCTLVVTMEPCTMCAGALLSARMGRLVYGTPDPRAGAAGSVWDVVRDRRLGPPVEVIGGVLAGECAAVLSRFFQRRR
jgi:tRNA(adenine34) deaminase